MGTMELTTLVECVLTESAGKQYMEQPSACTWQNARGV